jgi:hypothetical protein
LANLDLTLRIPFRPIKDKKTQESLARIIFSSLFFILFTMFAQPYPSACMSTAAQPHPSTRMSTAAHPHAREAASSSCLGLALFSPKRWSLFS